MRNLYPKESEIPLPSDIIIVRHGRFSGNVALDTTGEAALLVSQLPAEHDYTIGLDEVGQTQARHLGRHLLHRFPDGFAAGMRSDFARVIETADIALPDHVPLITRKELRERNRGKVARIPKAKLKMDYPDEARKKEQHPATWKPPGGESLAEKAADFKKLLPIMGALALDKPFIVFTSGEVVIAGRTLPELGNMDDTRLKRGITETWPALGVDNAEFDHYTRRDLSSGVLGDDFDYIMSVRAGAEVAIDTGWIAIDR